MANKLEVTLDEATLARLEHAGARLGLPLDQVVREAIREFYQRIGGLSEREKLAMLRALDEFLAHPPAGDARAVDHELRGLRESRRLEGGALNRAESKCALSQTSFRS